MPSRPTPVVPTLSVVRGPRGLGRRFQSATKPDCEKCGHAEHVVRLWHGPVKMWACGLHYEIQTPETKKQSFRERLFHKQPEAVTITLAEALPNRKARRGATR